MDKITLMEFLNYVQAYFPRGRDFSYVFKEHTLDYLAIAEYSLIECKFLFKMNVDADILSLFLSYPSKNILAVSGTTFDVVYSTCGKVATSQLLFVK